jgi:ankyrin repeat protein
VVELLLAADGIDVNAADALGATALMKAARNGDLKVYLLLVTF